MLGFVPPADIVFPVRTEPRSYFANERTLLMWYELSMTLAVLGAALQVDKAGPPARSRSARLALARSRRPRATRSPSSRLALLSAYQRSRSWFTRCECTFCASRRSSTSDRSTLKTRRVRRCRAHADPLPRRQPSRWPTLALRYARSLPSRHWHGRWQLCSGTCRSLHLHTDSCFPTPSPFSLVSGPRGGKEIEWSPDALQRLAARVAAACPSLGRRGRGWPPLTTPSRATRQPWHVAAAPGPCADPRALTTRHELRIRVYIVIV